MPPLTPGILIVWTRRPIFFFARFRHAAPFLPALHPSSGAASTIRMSLMPRPASSTQTKRPLVVSAPPPGWLPTAVSFPAGESLRPLGWIFVPGPIRPGGVLPPLWARAVVVIAVASSATSGRRRRFTGGMFSCRPCHAEHLRLAEDEPARLLDRRRQPQLGQSCEY